MTSTRDFKYPCVAAGLFLGSAHHCPFLAIWKLLLYFRAVNSKDKNTEYQFPWPPSDFLPADPSLLCPLVFSAGTIRQIEEPEIFSSSKFFSTHTLEFYEKLYICGSCSVNFSLISISLSILTIVALLLRHQVTRIRPIIWTLLSQCHSHHQ